MDGHTEGDAVRVGGDARQRFHDSRGYGRPVAGNEIALSRVEAAHLLFRGDLDAVDGDGFEPFFARAVAASERFVPRFLVYADLRERGFYLSPVREGWPGAADVVAGADREERRSSGSRDSESSGDVRQSEALTSQSERRSRSDDVAERSSAGSQKPEASDDVDETRSVSSARQNAKRSGDADLAVYERGAGPGGAVAYRVRVVGERRSVAAASLLPDGATGGGSDPALAVVDEESEITYFELAPPAFEGATDYDPPASLTGNLLGDRVLCWDAPEDLYERGFYGQPLAGRDADSGATALQLSLVEAASLAGDGHLRLASADDGEERRSSGDVRDGDDARAAAVERGRAVEGERFDRRLRVYRELRGRGVVPKTGYKFGADFRTYDEVTTVSELSHSERLVRVLPPDHEFDPRDLSLDVRLSGGVRKRMVFALTGANGETHWLSVGRLTP